mgnify:CR=1 FL=1
MPFKKGQKPWNAGLKAWNAGQKNPKISKTHSPEIRHNLRSAIICKNDSEDTKNKKS